MKGPKGSWLTPIKLELDILGRSGLGDLFVDEPGDSALPPELFQEATALRNVAVQGASGWASLQSKQPASPPDNPEDEEDDTPTRADKVFTNFVKNIGQAYGLRVPIKSADQEKTSNHAFWAAVDRGRSQGAGIKKQPVPGQTLEEAPGRIKFGKKRLKPYQLQDIGQLSLIDQVQKCPAMLHDMGLGKTIQAIATCEANWGGPVLIVAPATLRDLWLAELHATAPGRRIFDYRDQSRSEKSCKEIQNYEYVVVSYQAVEREFAQGRTFSKH